jgi:hypothetical protein
MSGWTSQSDRSAASVGDDQERRHTDAGKLRGPTGRVFPIRPAARNLW